MKDTDATSETKLSVSTSKKFFEKSHLPARLQCGLCDGFGCGPGFDGICKFFEHLGSDGSQHSVHKRHILWVVSERDREIDRDIWRGYKKEYSGYVLHCSYLRRPNSSELEPVTSIWERGSSVTIFGWHLAVGADISR